VELVERLRATGELSDPAAEAARRLPVATAVCAETQSGWLAGGDGGPGLLPAVVALREQEAARHGYRVWVGASGGTGCPSTVAAQFLAGAEFVLTGSVNQCTPQAATSDAVKELLSVVDIDDTSSAPAGELFELGGRTRVVSRRGVLFPARAAALYRAYRRHGGLGDLDRRTRRWCETECLGRPLDDVAAQVAAGEPDGRRRMALVFGHYFDLATRAALRGDPRQRTNWQIPCGPAMGAFNRSVAGTPLADWRERHADAVAGHLMSGAARMLGARPLAAAA
jgi:trans-AT polyketide synthase/acyltransferase/oxidoreductase domain-containing protein